MSVVEQVQQLEVHASGLIIGQSHLINRMIIALLCDGHLLVEGAPGLAKTRPSTASAFLRPYGNNVADRLLIACT